MREVMEVVFENDITIKLQALIRLLKAPRVQHDVDHGWAGEERKPFDDGAREEMRIMGFGDGVSASGHGIVLESERERFRLGHV